MVDGAAGEIGMVLNLQKTQLLCYNDSTYSDVASYIKIGNEIIESSKTIKILGYTMSDKPGVHKQIESIKEKVAIRTWTIRHLRKAGVPERDLVLIYMAFIRSVIEFACNVYGGFLTTGQSDDLERLQANALRAIYGVDLSYRRCLKKSGVPLLSERRHLLFLRFTKKIIKNEHFKRKWLVENEESSYDLRRKEKYKINNMRCERMEKTPISRMRRALNEIEKRGTSIEEEVDSFADFLLNDLRFDV